MAKKNSGKKMLLAGLAGEALSWAGGAVLLACPVSTPVAIGYIAWRGVTAAADVACFAGGIKSIYDAGFNKNEELNTKHKNERDKVYDQTSKLNYIEKRQLTAVYKLIAKTINDANKNGDLTDDILNLVMNTSKLPNTEIYLTRNHTNLKRLSVIGEDVNKYTDADKEKFNMKLIKDKLDEVAAIFTTYGNDADDALFDTFRSFVSLPDNDLRKLL